MTHGLIWGVNNYFFPNWEPYLMTTYKNVYHNRLNCRHSTGSHHFSSNKKQNQKHKISLWKFYWLNCPPLLLVKYYDDVAAKSSWHVAMIGCVIFGIYFHIYWCNWNLTLYTLLPLSLYSLIWDFFGILRQLQI